MFEIQIDGIDPLLAKLDKFAGQINELHKTMPQELEDWQREDMKRKYPNTQTDSTGEVTSATTFIWPRSRADKRQQRHQGPKLYSLPKRGPVVRSNRPILRAILQDQLYERMRQLVAGAMQWP